MQLEKMMSRFGQLHLALAAHNAGPGRVDRWLQQFGAVDGAQFIERIPSSENRANVRRVLTNRGHYRALVGHVGAEGN